MSKGIEISFLSNVRDFLRGAERSEDALDKVADSLDDVAKDGDQATDRLARGFKDIADDARDSTRDIDRVGDSLSDAARKGRAIDTDVRIGTDGAGEAVREWGDEARANISETFSSFRGEATDLVQVVQDTFGGVIGALGPVGMAAGIAGAAGLGLMMGALEEGKEEAQEMRERVGELAGQLIEIGDDPVAALDALVEGLKELATNSEEGETSLADLRAAAAGSATSFQRLADAYAGNTDELGKMIKAEQERLDIAEEAANADKRWDSATTQRLLNARDNQRTVVEGLEKAAQAAKEAEAEEAAWLASNGPLYEARAEKIDSLQGELNDTIGIWSDYEDKEKKSVDPAGYMEAMQARIDATTNFNANVQTLADATGLTMEEAQLVLDQGVDFAPMLASIVKGGDESMEQYAGLVQQIVGGGQEIADGNPLKLKATGDTEQAKADIDDAATDRDTTIKAKPESKAAASDLDAVADKKRTAHITAKASTGAARAALNALQKNRTATVTADASTWQAEQELNRITRPRSMTVTVDFRDREGKAVKP